MSPTALRGLCLLGLVACLPACVAYEGRDLSVSPGGVLYASDHLRLRVGGELDRVMLEVDGRSLGVQRANEWLLVPMPLADGTYTLRIRAQDATPPLSLERTLVVDRTWPTGPITVDPPAGAHARVDALAVTVRFPGRIERDLVTPERLAVTGWNGTRFRVVPTVSEDATTVRFELPASLEALESVRADLTFRWVGRTDDSRISMEWWQPSASVSAVAPVGDVRTSGDVAFQVNSVGDPLPSIEFFAGDRVIASLGPAPWSFTWRTADVPEGTYAISVRPPPGYRVYGSDWLPRVTVDRTAPQLTACETDGSAGVPSAAACTFLWFTEPVNASAAQVTCLVDGVAAPAFVLWSQSELQVCGCGEVPPFTRRVDVTGARDLAGNAMAPASCEVVIPLWRSPVGAGPIAGLRAAGGVSARFVWDAWLQESILTVLAVAPDGEPMAGEVRRWSIAPPAPPAVAVWPLNVEPGSVASDVEGEAWLEASGGGPRQVYSPTRPTAWSTPGREARALAYHPAGESLSRAAWSEEDPEGGRVVRFTGVAPGDAPTTLPRREAGAAADEPAVSAMVPAFRADDPTVLAWVEAAPGGVPQLCVGSATAPLPTFGNVAPGVPAAQPAVWQYWGRLAVAWVEGGRVHARLATKPGSDAPDDAAVYSDVATLNVDPARPARRPRFETSVLEPRPLDPILFWIEDAGDRDAVWARRWNGEGWELLPEVSAGFTGRIASLSTVSFGTVAWTDTSGRVYVREWNR